MVMLASHWLRRFPLLQAAACSTTRPRGLYTQFVVDDKGPVEDLSDKVFDTNVGSLLTARDQLDPEVLEIAINTINNANRVEFYGFGASCSVAADAQHKFFRLQLSSPAYTDRRCLRYH
jgi:RpiR family carbohydrate utilization transcriptional regulator